MDDQALLEQYVASRSQDAFAALVRRHVDLVYAAALRRTRDPHLADDVTQATFLLLSQKAASLKKHVALTGWLYNTARYTASAAMRSQHRRQRHEQAAGQLRQTNVEFSSPWDAISLHIDEVMDRLSEKDRQLVLLRYFEHRRQDEVGQMLGISEAAATKRLSRVIEKLRKHLEASGIAMTAPAIVASLDAYKPNPAPTGIVPPSVGAAGASSGAIAIVKAAAGFKFAAQLKIVVATLCVLVVGLLVDGIVVNRMHHAATAAPANFIVAAQWDLSVSPQMADQLRQISTPMADKSVGFESWVCDTAELLRTVAAKKNDNHFVYSSTSSMMFEWLRQMEGWKDGYPINWNYFSLQRVGGNEYVQLANVEARLKMDDRKDGVQLSVQSDQPATLAPPQPARTLAIHFDGKIAASKSVIFANHVSGPRESWGILVLQMVPTTSEQGHYIIGAHRRLNDWLQLGLDGIDEEAKGATDWLHRYGSPENLPVKWTQTIGGSSKVTLLAVSNGGPGYQWWTGDGVPTTFGPDFLHGDEPTAVIEVVEPSLGAPPGISSGSRSDARGSIDYSTDGSGKSRIMFKVESLGHIRFQIGAGPWTSAGTLGPGRPLQLGKLTFAIEQPPGESTAKNGTFVLGSHFRFRHAFAADATYALAVVDRNGAESPCDPPYDVRVAPLPANIGQIKDIVNLRIKPGDVDHFVIEQRPLVWVEFSGVATSPNLSAKRQAATKPVIVPPVAGSPEAAVAAMADAVERLDVVAAKAIIDRTDPQAAALLDGMLAQAIAGERLEQAMTRRFGADEVERMKAAHSIPFPEFDNMRAIRWQVAGDRATPIDTQNVHHGDGTEMKRIGGQWKFSMSIPPGADATRLAAVSAQADRQAAIANRLADEVAAGKYADVDAVKDAFAEAQSGVASQPASRPTS